MSTRAAPDRYLELGGARLHWRIEGSGPPIVLLHGWALDLHSWDFLVELLAPRFTVLRFDRRGFGMSGGIPDIHANVGDLLALLDAAGIDRPMLVGMSQGARLAIHFSLEHPERTRALVLDGAPALEAESELPLTLYRSLLESQGPAALQREVLLHPLMKLHGTDPAAARHLADVVARYNGQDLLHPPGLRRRPDLGAIAAPVLILNGSADSMERREAGQRLQAAITGARHLVLQNAGHLAMLDNAAAYAQALDAFCATLPPSA